jgi:hypothetical protein
MTACFPEELKIVAAIRFGSDCHLHQIEKINFLNGWYGEDYFVAFFYEKRVAG